MDEHMVAHPPNRAHEEADDVNGEVRRECQKGMDHPCIVYIRVEVLQMRVVNEQRDRENDDMSLNASSLLFGIDGTPTYC